jgi:hypothetical protein
MSAQPTTPQPAAQTIIRMQTQEINRLNDNRIFLMALLEDTKAEALAEIGMRDEEIARLQGLLDEAQAVDQGEEQG